MIWLQKEREAFEEWYENVIGRSLVYKTYDKSYLNSKTQEAWLTWQASASREGYKLVPVEINYEIESAMFSSVARGEMPCDIYKAMIGAQESTND